MFSPGFEPGIFRVSGERIDQLSHENEVTTPKQMDSFTFYKSECIFIELQAKTNPLR